MNVLLITLDQFRGDTLSSAGHGIVKTPHLDHLAGEGVQLARHYSQATPCGPGRASLYTGMYQMNHRVVGNGTPLDDRFDNIARAARRAGYAPTLFGYTDQAIDPRVTDGSSDPRLRSYEEVLPGFEVGVHLPEGDPQDWLAWLTSLGYTLPAQPAAVIATEAERPAEHSMAAFLTGCFRNWLETRDHPWFAHLSHLRPHPPYAAAGHFAAMYEPDAVDLPIAPAQTRHRLHDGYLRNSKTAAPKDERALRRMRAQYYGMVSEVDFQLGRIWETLKDRGQWDDTFIVVTSDHGDQLGDHGLIQKLGYFEESFHIPGLVRDPRLRTPRVVEAFTENVDIFPTLCEVMRIPVPAQCDGFPLTPLLRGVPPPVWRDAAHWEFDWRTSHIAKGRHDWPWDRRLERQNLAVRRDADSAYVHFADGSSLCFDLAADQTWRTPVTDPTRLLEKAQAMLTWRAQHADRAITGTLIDRGVVGRWPGS